MVDMTHLCRTPSSDGETIRVYTRSRGSTATKGKPILIPRAILCRNSKVLNRQLSPKFSKFQQKHTFHFEDDDDHFATACLIFWMVHEYFPWFWFPHKTVATCAFPDTGLTPEEPITVLLRIWSLGARYEIPKFQNEVMGELCDQVYWTDEPEEAQVERTGEPIFPVRSFGDGNGQADAADEQDVK